MSSKKTIVVADDDDDIRECVALLLQAEGYATRMARNGLDAMIALDALGDARCILFLDLMMPVMSGFEVLEALADQGRLRALPVVVLSALGHPGDLPPGVHKLIEKPPNLDTLLGTVRAICSAG